MLYQQWVESLSSWHLWTFPQNHSEVLHIAGSWELVSWSPHGNSDNIRSLPHLFDDSVNSDPVASVTHMSKQIYTDIMSRRNIFHQAPDQLKLDKSLFFRPIIPAPTSAPTDPDPHTVSKLLSTSTNLLQHLPNFPAKSIYFNHCGSPHSNMCMQAYEYFVAQLYYAPGIQNIVSLAYIEKI